MREDYIFRHIAKERDRQDAKWGGPQHDAGHSNLDWVAYIAKHLGRAVQWPFNATLFRMQMVRVAALAVAAIAWADRMTGTVCSECGMRLVAQEEDQAATYYECPNCGENEKREHEEAA